MCEVEFWEVFRERTKVFKVVPSLVHVLTAD